MNRSLLLPLLMLLLGLVVFGIARLALSGDEPAHDEPEAGVGPGLELADRRGAELAGGGEDAPDPAETAARTELQVPVQPVPTPEEPAGFASDPQHTVVRGRAVDPRSQPIRGARIELGASLGQQSSLATARALGHLAWEVAVQSNDRGTFEIKGVPAHGLQLLMQVSAPARPVTHFDALQPVPGDVLDLGDVVLADGAQVRGVVRNELGGPIQGAEVRWAPSYTGILRGRMRDAEGTLVGLSDAGGSFTATELPPGELRFAARAQGYSSDWSLPVRLEDGQRVDDLELVVGAGRPLVGTVHAFQGEPVIASLVAWQEGGENPKLTGESDAGGHFSIPGAQPGHRYSISVAAPGYRDRWISRVRLPEKGEPDEPIPIELFPAVDVQVVALDAETDEPVEGAWVAWAGQTGIGGMGGVERNGLRAGAARWLGTTDAEGRLTLEDVADVSRSVVAAADGYAPAVERLGIPRDDPTVTESELVLRLERGTRLEVIVVGAGGPLAGARVELRQSPRSSGFGRITSAAPDPSNLAKPLLARGTSGPDGVAEFPNLPEDMYLVTAEAEDHARVLSEAFLLDSSLEEFPLEVYLPAAGSLVGRVQVRGQPAPRQLVVATALLETEATSRPTGGEKGLSYTATTDATGSYALTGLAPGDYELVAWRDDLRSAMDFVLGIGAEENQDRKVQISLVEGEHRLQDLEGESDGLRLSGVFRVNHQPRAGATIRTQRIRTDDDEEQDWSRRWRRALTPTAHTDGEGRFVVTGLTPGRWIVYAEDGQGGRGWDARLAQMEVEMREGEDLERDLSGATTTLALEYRLDDPNAQPPRYIRVTLRPNANEGGVPGFPDSQRWSYTIGRSGKVEVEDVPEGHYFVEGGTRQLFTPRQPLELVAGRPEELELPLLPRE